MIKPQTISFLTALKKNNKKEWFDKNRPAYEAAKADFQAFLTELIVELAKFDKPVAGLDPKKCMFRINRDVRFSKDKSPYKTNLGASISPGGRKSDIPGYYIHIEPGSAFLAGGVWMPEPDKLNAIRQEIDYNFKEFQKVVNDKNFKKHFGKLSEDEKLVNPPKGFEKDNPALEFLKLKSFVAYEELGSKDVLSKSFLKQCVQSFKAMHKLNLFLRRALD
jgi:uncharacterized protein (TIGR02453 family)